MRRLGAIVVGVQAATVAAFAVALRSGRMPLGVPGQWEWQRVQGDPSRLNLLMGLAAVAGYSMVAAMGFRALSGKPSGRRVKAWLLGLAVAAVGVQGFVQEAAPEGYGLSKWILALHSPGSSGYYTVARSQMSKPRRFLADYPAWIARQDALHVGTHPPGLFVVARAMLDAMEAHPSASRLIGDLAPGSSRSAIRVMRDSVGLPRLDAAALAMIGALTLGGCALTVVPLYYLARSAWPESASWAAAALWPLVPSALMFQPTADTAFPLLSTTSLALACWSGRVGSSRGRVFCVVSGLVLALGMFFTLAFLPVGLVVALVLATTPDLSRGRRVGLILATGLGFLAGTLAWWALTSANPFAIWWVNQRNHARFYAEYPRSYAAWVVENPLELAIALGLPTAIWTMIGLGLIRQSSRVSWITVLVLALLTVSGKNLSEVARLWLPMMPPLLVAAGSGVSRAGCGGWTLAGSIALVGVEALILEATIQVVYPV